MHFIPLILDHFDRHAEEYKIGILNFTAFFVSTRTSTEKWLQIILLCVSIIYTVFKTAEIIDNKIQKRKSKNDEND